MEPANTKNYANYPAALNAASSNAKYRGGGGGGDYISSPAPPPPPMPKYNTSMDVGPLTEPNLSANTYSQHRHRRMHSSPSSERSVEPAVKSKSSKTGSGDHEHDKVGSRGSEKSGHHRHGHSSSRASSSHKRSSSDAKRQRSSDNKSGLGNKCQIEFCPTCGLCIGNP